jgi:hypothetical protein
MRRLLGAFGAVALSMVSVGTAHAGYAHFEVRPGTIGDVITRFNAGPGEKPDVSVQFVDFTTMLIEDRANPISAGAPPTGVDGNIDPNSGQPRLLYENAQPCEVISTHVARCMAPPGLILREMEIDTGELAAQVHDLPGGVDRPIAISSGPLPDHIELLHHEAAVVRDAGGNNRIRLGAGSGGLWEPTNSISVGPGSNVVNVRNGVGGDRVTCLASLNLGDPLPVVNSPFDHVFADPGDDIRGCERS